MTREIDTAAAALLRKIDAPAGVVNTMAARDAGGWFIRVLVDPAYHFRLLPVPPVFAGFRVVVEDRQPTFAYGR
jgi:hypothetical protein